MYRNATTCLMAPVLRKRASRGKSRAGNPVSGDAPSLPGSLSQTEGIRHELVARIRAEIASGKYDTEQKMEIALQRLLDQMS